MLSTIKSSREIDRVFSEAKRTTHPLVAVLVARTPDGRGPAGRVAFIAGKKTGGAVARNRAKRVLRGAVKAAGVKWPGWDVVVLANQRTGAAGSSSVGAALACILDQTPAGDVR
ncbi:MAG: ribonuclease P protein component [Actinomycetota bacterium]|nr:ribonuclease P protein component [Actinomycetota bacterium]